MAVATLVTAVWQGEALLRYGFVNHAWVVLLLFAGSAMAFAFGAGRNAKATYEGTVLGGKLLLHGPVVVAFAVVVLGFWLVPTATSGFDLTVFVHDQRDQQVPALRNRGFVVLDLGSDRRREQIGDKGEARFVRIPADQLNRRVPISVDADEYEVAFRDSRITLDSAVAYLPVRPKSVLLQGLVLNSKGRPLPDARVSFLGEEQTTDENGGFAVLVPVNLATQKRRISVSATGYAGWEGEFTPGSNRLELRMEPLR